MGELIVRLNYPIVFLFRLESYREEITEDNLNTILRFFLKNHMDIARIYDIRLIFSKNIEILDRLYFYLLKEKECLNFFKNSKSILIDNIFWELNLDNQIDMIISKQKLLKSIFDCSNDDILYFSRLFNLLNTDYRDEMLNDLIKRFEKVIEYFGKNLLKKIEIPIITVELLLSLTNEEIIKYSYIVYEKLNNILKIFLNTLFGYKYIYNEIKNIINPIIININDSNVDSDTEDISLFTKKY